jgi:hypothetical protein
MFLSFTKDITAAFKNHQTHQISTFDWKGQGRSIGWFGNQFFKK